jgi:dephospho-CoA kinase
MVILGLTGCIAMGKSAAADMFVRLGVPVHDADEAVHRLLGPGGGAVAAVEAAFPGSARDGAIDHEAVARRVFGDPVALKRLEGILHPLVKSDQGRFLAAAARRGERLVVLDVPLLFETGGDEMCDYVAVVSAPRFIQTERLLKRPGMTRERIDAIRGLQMSDLEKRRRADYVIPTGLDRSFAMRGIEKIVNDLKTNARRGSASRPRRHDRSRVLVKGEYRA